LVSGNRGITWGSGGLRSERRGSISGCIEFVSNCRGLSSDGSGPSGDNRRLGNDSRFGSDCGRLISDTC